MNPVPYFMMGLELSAFVTLFFILWGMVFESAVKERRNVYFIFVVAGLMCAIACDFFLWFIDIHHVSFLVANILYACGVLFNLISVIAFCYYELECINAKRDRKLSFRFASIPRAFMVAGALLSLIFFVLGKALIMSPSGEIEVTGFYYMSDIFTMAVLFYLCVLIVRNAKYLHRHDVLALLCYTLIPFIGIAIEILTGFECALFLSSNSMLIIFITLQSGQVSAIRLHEKLANDVAIHDDLTGLLNRKAFDRVMSNFLNNHCTGVIFCNLNRTKYINDNFGQRAGDQQLVKAASILKGIFDEDKVYRLGGDVFVAMSELDRIDFFNLVGQLSREFSESGDIASFGSVYSTDDVLPKMVSEAESRMYEDKKAYYSRHPEFTRHY